MGAAPLPRAVADPPLLGDLRGRPQRPARGVPARGSAGACAFAGHAYQTMRNLAVAEGLVQDELWAVARAWFVLCAHESNPRSCRSGRPGALLPESGMAPLLSERRNPCTTLADLVR